MNIQIGDLLYSNETLWIITDIYEKRYDIISVDMKIKNFVYEHTVKDMRKWYLDLRKQLQ